MRNPIDGYQDVYPWPHHWSREVAGGPISRLAVAKFLYPDLDVWTYGQHWTLGYYGESDPPDYVTDLYWSDDAEERLQLPPDVGHVVADLLVLNHADAIRVLIWWGRYWTYDLGWRDYHGPQGDFVDHIHVEWRKGSFQ